MHLDPILPEFLLIVTGVLIFALAARALRQPTVVAYILAGIVLGPSVVGVFDDVEVPTRFGAFGVLLLLFFVGMEIHLEKLLASWKIALLGTIAQIGLSLLFTFALGTGFDWPVGRSVLLGFVISLSSTAVVIRLLQEHRDMDTDVGTAAIGVLIVQDLAVVPMILVLGWLGGGEESSVPFHVQVLGGVATLLLAIWLVRAERVRIPFEKRLLESPDLQVFAGLLICFGLAAATGALELSSAFGAFLGGILISKAHATMWVRENLEPFHIVFVALFFVSIGLLVDLEFARENWLEIVLLLAGTLVVNTLINAGTMKLLGYSLRDSLYIGALLAQVGEFSFVLAALGFSGGMISDVGYQLTLSVIIASLVVSPFWIALFRKLALAKGGRAAGSSNLGVPPTT